MLKLLRVPGFRSKSANPPVQTASSRCCCCCLCSVKCFVFCFFSFVMCVFVLLGIAGIIFFIDKTVEAADSERWNQFEILFTTVSNEMHNPRILVESLPLTLPNGTLNFSNPGMKRFVKHTFDTIESFASLENFFDCIIWFADDDFDFLVAFIMSKTSVNVIQDQKLHVFRTSPRNDILSPETWALCEMDRNLRCISEDYVIPTFKMMLASLGNTFLLEASFTISKWMPVFPLCLMDYSTYLPYNFSFCDVSLSYAVPLNPGLGAVSIFQTHLHDMLTEEAEGMAFMIDSEFRFLISSSTDDPMLRKDPGSMPRFQYMNDEESLIDSELRDHVVNILEANVDLQLLENLQHYQVAGDGGLIDYARFHQDGLDFVLGQYLSSNEYYYSTIILSSLFTLSCVVVFICLCACMCCVVIILSRQISKITKLLDKANQMQFYVGKQSHSCCWEVYLVEKRVYALMSVLHEYSKFVPDHIRREHMNYLTEIDAEEESEYDENEIYVGELTNGRTIYGTNSLEMVQGASNEEIQNVPTSDRQRMYSVDSIDNNNNNNSNNVEQEMPPIVIGDQVEEDEGIEDQTTSRNNNNNARGSDDAESSSSSGKKSTESSEEEIDDNKDDKNNGIPRERMNSEEKQGISEIKAYFARKSSNNLTKNTSFVSRSRSRSRGRGIPARVPAGFRRRRGIPPQNQSRSIPTRRWVAKSGTIGIDSRRAKFSRHLYPRCVTIVTLGIVAKPKVSSSSSPRSSNEQDNSNNNNEDANDGELNYIETHSVVMESIEVAMRNTEGCLISFDDSTFCIGFNTFRKAESHTFSATRFCEDLLGIISKDFAVSRRIKLCFAVCRGVCHVGVMGTKLQRQSVVFGSLRKESSRLCKYIKRELGIVTRRPHRHDSTTPSEEYIVVLNSEARHHMDQFFWDYRVNLLDYIFITGVHKEVRDVYSLQFRDDVIGYVKYEGSRREEEVRQMKDNLVVIENSMRSSNFQRVLELTDGEEMMNRRIRKICRFCIHNKVTFSAFTSRKKRKKKNFEYSRTVSVFSEVDGNSEYHSTTSSEYSESQSSRSCHSASSYQTQRSRKSRLSELDVIT